MMNKMAAFQEEPESCGWKRQNESPLKKCGISKTYKKEDEAVQINWR
jgi:hypothetical protein